MDLLYAPPILFSFNDLPTKEPIKLGVSFSLETLFILHVLSYFHPLVFFNFLFFVPVAT